MKLKRYTETDKMILLSVAFTILLLMIRVFRYSELLYLFYPWNIFLALVPYLFSRALRQYKKLNLKTGLLLTVWLLFFPNAPYLLTDIFHFEARPPVPSWFDLLIVSSGAFTGLLICFISLRQVEIFIEKQKPGITRLLTPALLLLSSYGVYIGRYVRYNSWDAVTQPVAVIKTSGRHVLQPFSNMNVWFFTLLFTAFLSLVYFVAKHLRYVKNW